MSLDSDFGRAAGADNPRCEEACPGVRLRDAWVYHPSRVWKSNAWEFHYRDFYWHGSASSAYEARAKGWSAYLAKLDVKT